VSERKVAVPGWREVINSTLRIRHQIQNVSSSQSWVTALQRKSLPYHFDRSLTRLCRQALRDCAAQVDEGMAHGLEVRVSGHPATTQDCRWEASNWVRPSAASDVCAFCLRFGDNRFRCTGCQIVACQPCFGQIALLAQGPNDYPLDDGPEYYRVYT
jgi:hypothetical protein